MASASLPEREDSAAQASGWPRALMLLAALSVALFGVFHSDFADLAGTWWNSSTYNHCLLISVIIGWLVAQRRPGLRQLEPVPWALPLLWLGLGALLWLIGAMASVTLFRHAALVLMGQGLVMAVLGPAVTRALLFPIFYAFFLIPVGSEMEPYLQIITARMAIVQLWLAGVPSHIEGIFITIPNGYFRVAEACSGTAFLIAMAAYATLAANLCFTAPWRRVSFIAFALATCLLANGVRAFGIIFFAYNYGVASAVVVDHVVYGWLFFAMVILIVMAIGRRWFDRAPQDDWFDPDKLKGIAPARTTRWQMIAVAALVLIIAPAGWAQVSRAMTAPLPAETYLPNVPGWRLGGDSNRYSWRPHFIGADRISVGHYHDDRGQTVDLAIVQFAYQDDGKKLVGFGQGAAGPDGSGDWTWAAPAEAPAGAKGEILAGPGAIHRRAYSFYSVSGAITGSPARVKLETLKARLIGGDQRAVALIVATPQEQGAEGEEGSKRALAAFLAALGPVKSVADRSLSSD